MRSSVLQMLSAALIIVVEAVVVSALSQCAIQSADVVLIVDGSGSVGEDDWTKSLNYMANLIDGFDVGYDRVRVGMISFGTESTVAFKLNSYRRKSDVINAIVTQKRRHGSRTEIYKALDLARSTLFQTKNGMRQSTPNIVFLITDGQSQDPDKTMESAKKLHAENVAIYPTFVISKNAKVKKRRLRYIGSDRTNALYTSDFSQLAAEQNQLRQKTCQKIADQYSKWKPMRARSKPTTSTQKRKLSRKSKQTETTSTTTPPTTTTTTTTPSITPRTTQATKISPSKYHRDCYDRSSSCANSGRYFCSNKQYEPLLRLSCAKTCGFCKPRDIYKMMVRQLDIVAKYDIKCSLLTDNIALSTLKTLANGNTHRIREICQQDCGPQTGSEAVLSCENDALTVIWPTDVTYNGAVTEIPSGLKKRLTDRLAEQSRYPILNLLVLTKIPPLVYPTKTNIGAYAELTLTSSCLQNMNYDQTTDSCL